MILAILRFKLENETAWNCFRSPLSLVVSAVVCGHDKKLNLFAISVAKSPKQLNDILFWQLTPSLI
jgi:hypothetical protein